MNYLESLPPGQPLHGHSHLVLDERGVWDMTCWWPNDWRCRIGQAIYAVSRAIGRVADRIDAPGRRP